MKHTLTETTKENFEKLESRLLQINHPENTTASNMQKFLNALQGPSLIMATGGSKVVANYLKEVLERKGCLGIICEVVEPRDFFYKNNRDLYQNLIVISASGNTAGITKAFEQFGGTKYLITQKEKKINGVNVISWGNEIYDTEKSFISLASSLGPMLHLLDAIESQSCAVSPIVCKEVNEKVKILLQKSKELVEQTNYDFASTKDIQILSGYDTKTASGILESNIIESGLASVCIHDKGSFCHGRHNLLFQKPNSAVIYLSHEKKSWIG